MLVAVAAPACAGGGGGSDAPNAERPTTVRTSAATSAETRSTSAPHPPRKESATRLARRLTRRHAREDERLTEAANALIALEASVYCWDERGWNRVVAAANAELPPEERGGFAGFADFYAVRIDLAPWVCSALRDLDATVARDDVLAADALQVLAHETRHFSATGSNEAVAECHALQRVDELAAALGAEAAVARRLAELAWTDVYPSLPAEYRSPECKPGGALDREPETPEFP